MESISLSAECNSNLSKKTENDCPTPIKTKLVSRRLLKKQLEDAQKKNFENEDLLVTKNEEITQLTKSVSDLNDLINSKQVQDLGKGSSIATSKICELSRKNRQLIAELESFKSKYEKERKKVLKLETETNNTEDRPATRKDSTRNLTSSSRESLQEELHSVRQKLFETLNQNTELKNSLKLAQKCIQKEIGEDMNLNILAQANTNWRGRAQQIIALQKKNSELKEKLDFYPSVECYQQELRKLEAIRKDEVQKFMAHINELQETVESQKGKLYALKVRNKNLSDEVIDHKFRAYTLMEQSGENNSSIAVLMEKMNIQKYEYDNKIINLHKEIKKLNKTILDIEIDHESTKTKLENEKQLVVKKELKIEELLNTIKKMEADMREICGDFLFSCRDLNKDEFMAMFNALESEKTGLLQQNKILHERLEYEREKETSFLDQISKLKMKISRLETKIREMQRQQELQQEKKKRSQRIADYANNLSNRLSTIIIENSNSCTSLNDRNENDSTLMDAKFQMEELKNKLELEEEKVLILEDQLNHLKLEKEKDASAFSEIITNSKTYLLNTIQSNKKCGNNIADGSRNLE